ncbi:Flp pilus assembly complex ATPase component TadA [bacterium]|nr:Flp pilus assembly complex ATPase component TadA [bacterium]
MSESDSNKKLLGDLLVEKGLIGTDQLQRALADQRQNGGRLGYCLVRLGLLSAETLIEFFKENESAGHVLEDAAVRQQAAGAVPRSLALYYKIAPIKLEGNLLTVALAEVPHPQLVRMLAEITGLRMDALIQSEQQIRALIDSSYRLPIDPGLEFSSFDDNAFVIADSRKGIKALTSGQLKNETHVGERFRSMIAEAIKEKFREILIKPEADQAVVYFKKETLKQSEFALTSAQQDDITFLLFRLAKMNLLQQKKAQNGRFIVKVNDRRIQMVVSNTPTIYGTRFLLEMFDEKILKHSFDELLKPFPEVRNHIEDFLTVAGKGILIITGPDGSGRTHFLYSLLSRAKEIYRNIHMLEISIRYPLTEIHQNEVSADEMERSLEEYLYQPPELLAIASLKTVRAAELSFLMAARIPVVVILSSFDAYKAVEWLCTHNLKSPLKAGLLHTIISPRKIPRVCPHCSVPYESGMKDFVSTQKLPAGQLKMNQGCDFCRNQEDLPSEIFFECFRINEEAIQWILKDHSAAHLRSSARSAGRNILYDLVIRDAFSDHLDMLAIAKLQAAL